MGDPLQKALDGRFAILSAFKTDFGHSANLERDRKLKKRVVELGYVAFPGAGIWDGDIENSVFVPNCTKQDAQALAEAFEQDAYVFGEKGFYEILNTRDGSTVGCGASARLKNKSKVASHVSSICKFAAKENKAPEQALTKAHEFLMGLGYRLLSSSNMSESKYYALPSSKMEDEVLRVSAHDPTDLRTQEPVNVVISSPQSDTNTTPTYWGGKRGMYFVDYDPQAAGTFDQNLRSTIVNADRELRSRIERNKPFTARSVPLLQQRGPRRM